MDTGHDPINMFLSGLPCTHNCCLVGRIEIETKIESDWMFVKNSSVLMVNAFLMENIL